MSDRKIFFIIICFLIALFFIIINISVASMQKTKDIEYEIIEGQGIKEIVYLGDSLEYLKNKLGKPDEIVKDDWPNSRIIYFFYYKKGFEVIGEQNKVKEIVIYIKHLRFNSFNGVSQKGLRFSSSTTTNDIYKIYGAPLVTLKWDVEKFEAKLSDLRSKKVSYLIDYGNIGGIKIVYPVDKIEFAVTKDKFYCVIKNY